MVNAIRGLVTEGLLGAVLTGLMVLLFLRDWRSSFIVVATIPFALLSAVVWLWAAGQTLNIMTLGGLALAVGVLVDEATVEIENIHTHMAGGLSRARAVLDACRKTAVPRLLSMLCVLAVFVPSFFMVGVGRQLFVPLSLAVGFAMVSSYALSSTLVPVLSTWADAGARRGGEDAAARRLRQGARRAGAAALAGGRVVHAGRGRTAVPRRAAPAHRDLPGSRQHAVPATPAGPHRHPYRAHRTDRAARAGRHPAGGRRGPCGDLHRRSSGVQPASYPINTIYLFTSGPQEAVLKVALKPGAPVRGEELKERLRRRLRDALPGTAFSFEAGDIVRQVMSFGSPTPIEVAVQGPNLADDRAFAEKLRRELAQGSCLRDLQYGQPLDYPTVQVAIDRERAGQFGLTMAERGTLAGDRHFLQPLHGTQLLARPGQRQRLPDPGGDSPAEDGVARRCPQHSRDAGGSRRARCWAIWPTSATAPPWGKWTATTCSGWSA